MKNKRARSFLMMAIIPTTKPASPKAAIEKDGNGKKLCVFKAIKTINAILNITDHFPKAVFGTKVIFIRLIPFLDMPIMNNSGKTLYYNSICNSIYNSIL